MIDSSRRVMLCPIRLLALAALLVMLVGPTAELVNAAPGGARWAAPAEHVVGRTLYVDPSGSDTTGDGSAAKPWRTIQKAAGLVSAGDLVLINPGAYSGPITIETGGTAAAPIVFRGNGSGVVITGSGSERDAIFITYADYVTVEGVRVQNATRAGLRIDFSHHVTVRNSVFADNGTWGIFTDFSDDTLLEGNETYGSVNEHGIYISNSSDRPTIRGNRMHHNRANGLHMNGDLSQGGDGIISGGLVENNVIYENGLGGGSAVNMDGVTDTIVRNNLIYAGRAGGVTIYQIDGGTCSKRNQVLNNTIVLASDGRWAVNIANAGCTDNTVFNNVLYTAHSWRGSISIHAQARSGFQSDYNVVMDRFSTDAGNTRITLAAWQALGYDLHSRIATPSQLFVNEGADFHLKSGSPAIDAGTALANVWSDLEGNGRPRGAAYDVGAYESGLAGPAPTATPTRTPTAVPPTATATRTPTAAPPTATASRTPTPLPPTATATRTPTRTPTPLPPTATNTAVPPTATNTPLPPTATATSTAVPPTNTPPPTATRTPLPPTPTATPIPPTATPAPTDVPAPAPYPISRGGRSSGSAAASTVWDGDPGSFWVTTTSTVPKRGYVYVDLRAVKSIAFVRCLFADGSIADAVQVQISSNKTSWTTIAEFGNPPSGEWLEIPVWAEARYVRFYFTNPNRDPAIGGVAEIEVWG